MSKVVGVDVGGTFTDLILVDEDEGSLRVAKVLTTVDDQAVGALAAIESTGVSLDAIDSIVHGTTVTTNALLERKLSRCGLITTLGYRDTLELGRRTRPSAYGLAGTFVPLIPRDLRHEVDERMDAAGEVVRPLDAEGVRRAAEKLLEKGCESLAIHFLHAYANPTHERRAAEIAQALWPNRNITIGSDVLPQYREYERGVAAAVNASVQPILDRYIARFRDDLAGRGYANDLLVMLGNGGTVSSTLASEGALHTILSGPAAGVIAAAYVAGSAGFKNVVTYDMGGTSCDVALIAEGVPQVTSEFELEYAMPIHVPMMDIHTIGAGGGSIARVDEAGILQVGPESAGANPGPICYGRGGARPTISDANLALGRLNPGGLLAVESPVAVKRVKEAIGRHVGDRLGMAPTEAAAAIIQIANTKMAGALRLVSLSRGYDPRDFALFAFGGAGPLHGSAMARELGIPKVLVPAAPGLTCALGCIAADIRHDYVRSVNHLVHELDTEAVRRVLADQVEQGRQAIAREQVPIEELRFLHEADMQFQGQTHILRIPLDGLEVTRELLRSAFEKAYWARFQFELPEVRALLVNLRTAAIGRRRDVRFESLVERSKRAKTLADAQEGVRRVWFEGVWHATPIYRRDRLPARASFPGPAVIEQLDTTTVVEPEDRADVDGLGNLIISISTTQGTA